MWKQTGGVADRVEPSFEHIIASLRLAMISKKRLDERVSRSERTGAYMRIFRTLLLERVEERFPVEFPPAEKPGGNLKPVSLEAAETQRHKVENDEKILRPDQRTDNVVDVAGYGRQLVLKSDHTNGQGGIRQYAAEKKRDMDPATHVGGWAEPDMSSDEAPADEPDLISVLPACDRWTEAKSDFCDSQSQQPRGKPMAKLMDDQPHRYAEQKIQGVQGLSPDITNGRRV